MRTPTSFYTDNVGLPYVSRTYALSRIISNLTPQLQTCFHTNPALSKNPINMFKTNSSHISSLIYGSLFFLVLIATIGIYWQGLGGIFLFDNEVYLGDLNSVANGTRSIFFFSFEGIAASPLGRPLSYLTFALQANDWPLTFVMQANDWPYNPWQFKYVNLMIHLLNGCLVFWFILLITRLMALPEKRCLLLALLTTSVWLLHPLQTSAVLYVVQRTTQLSAFFTLAGLLVYLQGRQLMAQDQIKSGFFWITIGIVFGAVLATLSKENGVLLVLYVIVLEATVLRALPKPRYWQIWSGVFLYLPLILLASYFIIHFDSLLQSYETHHFTMGERLLTQAGILTEYIAKILLLHPYDFGLFHDDYPVSRTLLTPISTLITVSFVIVALVIAVWVRRLWPFFAFGILWFFAGHLLESSFIGLTLYFEYRNYLPMLGLIFFTIYGFLRLFDYMFVASLRRIAILACLLWWSIFPMITWSETYIWGRPVAQSVVWTREHTHSLAVQTHSAIFYLRLREYGEANGYIKDAVEIFPELTTSQLYLTALTCLSKRDGYVYQYDKHKIISKLQTSKFDRATPALLTFIVNEWKKGRCELGSSMIDGMFNALLANPNNTAHHAHFYHQYAAFHAEIKRFDLAVKALKQALVLRDSLPWRLNLVELLLANNQFDEAAAYLQEIRTQLNPLKAYLYEKDFAFFELQIQKKRQLREMAL